MNASTAVTVEVRNDGTRLLHPLPLSLLEGGPDYVCLQMDVKTVGKHNIVLRLHQDHKLGRPLKLRDDTAKHLAQAQTTNNYYDHFLSSDEEDVKPKTPAPPPAFKTPYQPKPLLPKQCPKAANGSEDWDNDHVPVQAAPLSAEPLSFMPVVVKNPISSLAVQPASTISIGLGRGRKVTTPAPDLPGFAAAPKAAATTRACDEGQLSSSEDEAPMRPTQALAAGARPRTFQELYPSVTAAFPKAKAIPTAGKTEEDWDSEDTRAVSVTGRTTGRRVSPVETEDCGGRKVVVVSRQPSWLSRKKDIGAMLAEVGAKARLVGEMQLQLGSFGMSADREDHFNQPTAVCLNERNGDLIVADSHNRLVKIFKYDGEMRALIGNEDPDTKTPFNDPSAVIVIPGETAADDRVAVKCENGLHIFFYDISNSGEVEPPRILLSIPAGHGSFLRGPMGLALTRDRLLVTISDARGRNPEIQLICPSSGDLVRRFHFEPRLHHSGKCQPRFLDAWEDRLVVSDLGLNCVYIFSLTDGRLLHEFGGFGRQEGRFTFASGVAIDGAGNILVGDAKVNRVQLFSKDGHFLRTIVFSALPDLLPKNQPPCSFPSGLHLSVNGHLMVTSRGQKGSGQVVNVYHILATL